MIPSIVQGATLVAVQEFRVRLRTGRWRWLLATWLVVLAVFTALLQTALNIEGTQGEIGVPLFGGLMLFVLALVLVISPALTAQSVNGDRERGTLATLQITRLTPTQIALGKLAAGWAVGLVALALTLPFVAWSMVEGGGLTITRVVAVLLVDALLMGVICAISQALSALLARTITSALMSYLVVFALSVGTLVAFGLANPLTSQNARMSDGSTYLVDRTDQIWWLLAPNPFVVLADSAPALPPRLTERGGRQVFTADDPLSGLRQEIRGLRRPPLEFGASYSFSPDDGSAVWPYGLGFDLVLGAAAFWVTTRRLRAPSRKLARGVRVG
jgi:ABC-type transport system involved in multi-copper enzyme maturation permease subunit